MSLIATARALEDQVFLWRVRAATLSLAVAKYSSSTASVNEKALAMTVLDYPMQQNRTLEALVAYHAPITAAVTVDPNNTVSTEAVTDAMIIDAVAAYWPAVSTRLAEIKAAAPKSTSTTTV
jgi:hypothetical protein